MLTQARAARLAPALLALSVATQSGCAAFSTVRSAEVTPGPSTTFQTSITTPPGDATGWFFSLDCATSCSHPIAAFDLSAATGFVPDRGPAFSIGAGLNGMFPYVESYLQLARGDRPAGLGARLGLSLEGWSLHQVHGRFDVPLRGSARLLLNPGIAFLSGNSPNGANPGSMIALTQGLGVELSSGTVVLVPSVTAVVAHSEHSSSGTRIGPETTAFLSFALAMTMGRR